jgi:hypothetical protein
MVGPAINKEGLRASDKGFLDMSLEDYIALLFWTGRQGREDKKGKITVEHAPILAKLGIAEGMWCDLVWNFKQYFGKSRGPGSPDRMREESILGLRKFQPGNLIAIEIHLWQPSNFTAMIIIALHTVNFL